MSKTDNPKVTIVTITYNLIEAKREKTFFQCIESVKNQTYENIEHIVIDGASTDGTIDLIKSTGLTYYSEPDNGIYDALNKGILKSTGEYILFLHSDDYFTLDNGIEESVKYLLKTNADFSYGSSTFLKKERYAGEFIPLIESFFILFPFPHQTMLTKKEAFIKHNLFDTNYKSAGDYDLILRMLLNGAKSVEVPLNFVNFRLDGFSDVNQEQSVKECAKLLKENYKQILGCEFDESVCRNMFCNFLVPKKLVNPIMERIDDDLKVKVEDLLTNGIIDFDEDYYQIEKRIRMKVDENRVEKRYIKILNIPFIKIVYMVNKTKFFLFNALPLFKIIDRNMELKYFLFSFLLIWKSRKMRQNGII